MARLSKNHYVNNKKFLETLIAYKELVAKHKAEDKQKPQIPNYVGECLILIANRLASKPNFSGYSFKDEMVSDGIEDCIKYLDNFDPLKGTNPFAYFTQFIWNAFIRRIQKEKKQLYIKMKNLEHSYSQEDIENISRDKARPKMTENYNDYITQWEMNKAKK